MGKAEAEVYRTESQKIQDAIQEYDETKARELDKEREIGFFENLFEEGSDVDRIDVFNALINKYNEPSRLSGETITQGGLDKGKKIRQLLEMAQTDPEMSKKIIDLARTGETLTVENVKAITGDYVPP